MSFGFVLVLESVRTELTHILLFIHVRAVKVSVSSQTQGPRQEVRREKR